MKRLLGLVTLVIAVAAGPLGAAEAADVKVSAPVEVRMAAEAAPAAKAAEEKAPADQPEQKLPAELNITFDDKETKDALAHWKTTGDVAIDKSKKRGEGDEGASLKIGPGGVATLKLADADSTGTIELWVFEDQTKPEDPKVNRAGPRWGLVQSDGNVLAVGALYAKYLSGDTTYATSDSDGKKKWITLVQYLGLQRNQGWHKWTFTVDNEKGITIAYDGADVNAKKKRFDCTKVAVKGFTALAIYGDSGKGNEQTLWIDDVTTKVTGLLKKSEEAPKEPAPEPAK